MGRNIGGPSRIASVAADKGDVMKSDLAEASGQFLKVLLEQHQNVPSKLVGAALELVATINAHQLQQSTERQSHLHEWAASKAAGKGAPPEIRVAG